MVKVRLARVGGKKNAVYRVVVADERFPRDGRYLEKLGYYDPHMKPVKFEINRERYDHWVKVGAQPTATVRQLFAKTATA